MKYLYTLFLLLSMGCSVQNRTLPGRYYTIDFQNVPFENIESFYFQYGAVSVDSIPMLESKGEYGIRKSYWIKGKVPNEFRLKIFYKGGKKVDKLFEIPENIYNRFGISTVFIDYANGSYDFSYKYGIVSYAHDETSFYFAESGALERVWFSTEIDGSSISREFKNFNGTMVNTLISYVNKSLPYVYIRKPNPDAAVEIEAYHHNHPEDIRIKYNENLEVVSGTRTEYEYHPGGARKSSKNYIVSDLNLLKSFPKPDLSFNNLFNVDIQEELSSRQISLKPPNK